MTAISTLCTESDHLTHQESTLLGAFFPPKRIVLVGLTILYLNSLTKPLSSKRNNTAFYCVLSEFLRLNKELQMYLDENRKLPCVIVTVSCFVCALLRSFISIYILAENRAHTRPFVMMKSGFHEGISAVSERNERTSGAIERKEKGNNGRIRLSFGVHLKESSKRVASFIKVIV